MDASQKNYCFCPPADGLLYVELPTQNQLLTFLIQQKWRGRANLRTLHGYIPYFGGGVAFHFMNLYLRGVKPSWFCQGDYETAVEELIQDGIFKNHAEAELRYSIYPAECEWVGPARLEFSLRDIDHIWLGGNIGKPLQQVEIVENLLTIFPELRIEDPPEPLGRFNPCR
jgi:hypothetical protein